jgi:hypothetical protein
MHDLQMHDSPWLRPCLEYIWPPALRTNELTQLSVVAYVADERANICLAARQAGSSFSLCVSSQAELLGGEAQCIKIGCAVSPPARGSVVSLSLKLGPCSVRTAVSSLLSDRLLAAPAAR